MSDESFNMNEFMSAPENPVAEIAEIDIQKAVVEELAAEKIELREKIAELKSENESFSRQLDDAHSMIEKKTMELDAAKDALDQKGARIAELEKKLDEANSRIAELDAKISEKLMREFDEQERNPNALALLDREIELPDRFPGETRDHVLEVVREARDEAEKSGRRRRAQLLEGVLVANEPNGALAKKRAALEKFFKDNGNIVTGAVINELERCGIAYKDGEEFLLPKEILLRTY